MIQIEEIAFSELVVPSWRVTYTLRPELLLIAGSLIEFGFIQPIHVRKSTGEIIDGSERFLLAQSISEISERCNFKIPAVVHDLDLIDSMMLHIRLNRGHSNIVVEKLSKSVKRIYDSGNYTISDLKMYLSMGNEELSVLVDGDLIKQRKIKEHNYSKAWVPIEAPSNSAESKAMEFESPPNADR